LCAACGGSAWGNVLRKEYKRASSVWYALPTPLDILYLLLSKTYVFKFPFCPNCSPGDFRLRSVRLDRDLAVFAGAAPRFLDALPPIPPDVQEEKDAVVNWQRFVR
jgi:hypothetical protein